jgi:hypothetical protein
MHSLPTELWSCIFDILRWDAAETRALLSRELMVRKTTQIAGSLLAARHLEEPTPTDVDMSEATHPMLIQTSSNPLTTPIDGHPDSQSSITDESIREKREYPMLIRFVAGKDDKDQDVMPLRWLMEGDFVDRAAFIGRMLKFAIMLYEHEVYVVDEDWRDYRRVVREPSRCGSFSGNAIA